MGKEKQQEQQLDDSSLPSINDSVDDKTLDSCNGVEETEELGEKFMCCVCLDLLYKPIVLACGHVSCFWCVHHAMSTLQESHCPVCRCPYNHFPSICLQLHFLLLKMYPVAYRKREKQILEEEKEIGFFSPQINNDLTSSHTGDKLNLLECEPAFAIICSQNISYPESPTKSNPSPVAGPQIEELSHEDTAAIPGKKNAGIFECSRTVPLEDNNMCQRDMKVRGCDMVSLSDVLCGACNKLLFQPVVLNCGHVYCKSCVDNPANEELKCQVCQCFHPKGVPKVCLELDHFLEEQFSEEYMVRRAAQPEPVHLQPGSPLACGAEAGKKENQSSSSLNAAWWSEYGSKVHVAVGCDYCGIFPIIGDRYQCKDCVEAIGFDLCGKCYNTGSKRPGRFNQQHTLDHKFELVKSSLLHNLMLRLIPQQPEDENIVPDLSDDDQEDPEVTLSTV